MSLETMYPLNDVHREEARKFIELLESNGYAINDFEESGNIKFASLTKGSIGIYLEIGDDRYVNPDKEQRKMEKEDVPV